MYYKVRAQSQTSFKLSLNTAGTRRTRRPRHPRVIQVQVMCPHALAEPASSLMSHSDDCNAHLSVNVPPTVTHA